MRTPTRDLEIIAGRVSADGTAIQGDGFYPRRTAVGQYTVYLEENFKIIAVTFSPITAATGMYGANIAPSEHGFWTSMFVSNTLAAVDGVWSFIAAGYRQ